MAALAAVAAKVTVPPTARRLAAAHADFWRFEGGVPALSPFVAMHPAGELSRNGRHLAHVLLMTALREPGLKAVAVEAAGGQDTRVAGVFLTVALAAETTLEASRLAREPARCEELLRRFALANGAPVLASGGAALEPAERSQRVLDRLDSAALQLEEVRLRRQQRLMEASSRARALIATGQDLG